MEKDSLIKIGLTPNEADIYLSLLESGPSLVSTIVKKTQINRTHIYDRLQKLIDKGLVSYVKKSNRKHFCAAKPTRILRYLEEKEDSLKKEKGIAKNIIPNLEKIMPEELDESVEIYEGKEGLKTILEEIIRAKKDILTYGSDGNFSRILRFYFVHYLKRLEKSKIHMRVIFNEDDTKKPFTWKFAQARYLPKEFKSPTETTIFSDKVVIFVLTKQPKAIVITSKATSAAYRNYFEIMWKMAKKRKL